MAYPQQNQLSHRPSRHLPSNPVQNEWRCRKCRKLLGVHRGTKLHLRLQGHDYNVSLPTEATCRACGTHNRT